MDSSDLPFQPAPGASSEATPGPSRTQAHHDDSDEEVQIPVLHRSDVVQDASTIAPHAIDEAFANQELFPLLATRAGVQDEYPEASEELWKESVETANLLAAALVSVIVHPQSYPLYILLIQRRSASRSTIRISSPSTRMP
jgi:hypothetical protein